MRWPNPELPLDVDGDAQQDGAVDPFPVYSTHRGKKALSRDVGGEPPHATEPDGALRVRREA